MPLNTVSLAKNQAARHFEQLRQGWIADTCGMSIDTAAANLQAAVVAAAGPVCLGVYRKSHLPQLHSLACFLTQYDLILRPRFKRDQEHAFIIAEVIPPKANDYAGAVVIERKEAVAA